jgi:YbbR domain-containing protein
MLGTLPDVTNIRYFAPLDVAARLSSSSFTATVDLSGAQVSPEAPFVTAKVEVMAADQRVQVLDFEPQVITVQLDPLISKTVPVEVSRGPVPPGLDVRDPVLSVSEVTASGPESIVRLVTAAQARVVIQPSGIDVDQQVDLVAVDVRGNVMTPIDLEPASAHVQIRVGSQLQSKALPVDPAVVGSPAAGYEIASVTVAPSVASIEGEADALASLIKLDTEPISVAGATADVTRTVTLALPNGTTALSGSTVRVTIALRPTTGTRTISAGIVLAGARLDRTYATSTDRVIVTIGGTVAALSALPGRTFVATADVSTLGPGSHEVGLRVTLPSGLTVVAIGPPSVVVTVGVPGTAAPTESPSPTPPASGTP